MDSGQAIVIAAVIGSMGTIIGAVIGRSSWIANIISRKEHPLFIGSWTSTWKEDGEEQEETFVVTQQRGNAIKGYITKQDEPDKKWDIEGYVDKEFVRLFWKPARDALNKNFKDYGCYFFEWKAAGDVLEGYAVGFDWGAEKTLVIKHKVEKVKA